MWVATWEAKLPAPRNSSGFIVATTMASGTSIAAPASAACAASAMRSGSGSVRRPIRVMPTPATQTLGIATILLGGGLRPDSEGDFVPLPTRGASLTARARAASP